jgi:hypothetical protein
VVIRNCLKKRDKKPDKSCYFQVILFSLWFPPAVEQSQLSCEFNRVCIPVHAAKHESMDVMFSEAPTKLIMPSVRLTQL